jgi:predicted nucleotidyltransferase
MSLSKGQLAALSELEQLWPEAEAVVIGATALGFYYDMSWRHTTDVDLVVALTVDVLPALANRPGWSRHPKREYEFTSPGGARVDLIPASPDLIRAGRLQWLNGTAMSLVGMDLAFKHAVRRDGVLVAPPAVVAILKMVAFSDRPAERERDLVDVGHLLDAYVKEDDERRWDETPDATEFDLAPAFLLGIDVARLLSHDEHRRVVDTFLSQVEAPNSSAHLLMLGGGPLRWRTEENALGRRLGMFRAGLLRSTER